MTLSSMRTCILISRSNTFAGTARPRLMDDKLQTTKSPGLERVTTISSSSVTDSNCSRAHVLRNFCTKIR